MLFKRPILMIQKIREIDFLVRLLPSLAGVFDSLIELEFGPQPQITKHPKGQKLS